MSVELEHDQYVRNLEDLVRARTEQLREAVTKIAELTAELEALKTKSSHQPDESSTIAQRKSGQGTASSSATVGTTTRKKISAPTDTSDTVFPGNEAN